MLIPLPELDDRRWSDLVEESRALIPVLAPEWTDHNASDPGITVIELYAWLAEMDVFRANRVTDAARRRFLALVGVAPRPASPAQTVVAFQLAATSGAVDLPAGVELEVVDPAADAGSTDPAAWPATVTAFRTANALSVVPGALRAMYAVRGHDIRSLSLREAGSRIRPFGDDPSVGDGLYLGFSEALPLDRFTTLYASAGGAAARAAELAQLHAELVADPGCGPVELPCDCTDRVVARLASPPPVDRSHPDAALRHHSAAIAWDIRRPDGTWQRLVDGEGQDVVDETRALTLDGRIRLRPPVAMTPGGEDGMDAALWYVRCRLADGAWDRAPELSDLSLNAVAAVQAVSPDYAADRLAKLPASPGGPGERFGPGTGFPWQRSVLSDRIVVAESLVVQTVEGSATRTWELHGDLDDSSGADAHVLLDPIEGAITFGDGDHGRVVPRDAAIYAAYLVTKAQGGNTAPGRPLRFRDRAAGAVPAATAGAVASIANVVAATGGAAAETLEHAEGRALDEVGRVTRAVTVPDIEELARSTPGTAVARATAIPGLFPAFPCVDAAGIVTVVVVPWLPVGRPMPSGGLLGAVRAFLERRRLIGTRIEVIGPSYLEVTARATVTADPGSAREGVRARVVDAVRQFFDPLAGGPDGTGWPLGRDVYRTEVLDVINRVEGVARVKDLELVAEGCGVCSNVCVGRTGLVASGSHEITVEAAR
jgi:predicted phage baseplate assembly protein